MMKRKILRLAGIWALTAALGLNAGTVFAASAASPQTPQENTAQTEDKDKPQEPAKPESYEWEIQSNAISGWPQGPKVVAETAVLMDLDTGEILYAKGIDEKRAPASTTKIMTAMLAIEKVPLDTKITFTDEVNNIESDSTHIGIKPGEILTMEESLYGILLASANEVSSGVAEYIGGTVQAFVDMMNQRAKELGCENTHFVNANGLYSEDHYTTARDLAIIAKEAFKNETFRQIIQKPYFIIPKTNITDEERWLNNHHKMLTEGKNHYDGCLGGKTGYTVKAGNTLVTYAERNNMRLVCVVLADNTEHYNDTAAILDYGFDNFQKLDPSSGSLKNEDDFGSYLDEQGLLSTVFQNASADVPTEPSQDISFKTELDGSVLTIRFYYGDTLLNQISQEVSQEILDAFTDFDLQRRQSRQVSQAVEKTNSQNPELPSETPKEKETLDGFFGSLKSNFQELPSWKYPALILLLAAFLFYIVLFVVKIKRARRRKKRRKQKMEKEGKKE